MSGANTWRGANTWSVALNENAQAGSGGSGVASITAGNTNVTITGTSTNPIISGTLTNLTSSVAGNNNFIAGMSAPPFGTSAITCAGTDTFLIEDTLFTPLLAVANTGVLLGGAGTLATVPVTAPTVTPSTDSTDKVATTAFVQSAIGGSGNTLQQVLTNGNTTTLDIILTDTNTTHTITPSSTSDIVFNVGTSGLGRIDTSVAEGNAQIFMGAGAGGSSNSLRTEITTSGGVLIDHETVSGTVQSMVLQSEGNIRMKGGVSSITNEVICSNGASGIVMNGSGLTVNSLPATVNTLTAGVNVLSASTRNEFNAGATTGNANPNTFLSSGAGGATNPMIRMENTNATGSCALEVYKNKPTAGLNGDVLYNQSVFGKDSTNAKQEYTRISHTIRESVAGTEDGSIEFGVFTNGSIQNYIQINGNDLSNGEVNILRPLDLASGSTGLIKTSVAGGSINITADTTGTVALNSAGGNILLNGNSATLSAGGSVNKFLDCVGVGGNITLYRPLVFTDNTNSATFQVVSSPFPSLQTQNLPLAVSSGFSDGSTTGSAGQVITAIGGGNWNWATPPAPPADTLSGVLSAGNSAGSSQINMDGNSIITSTGNFTIDASSSSGAGDISAILKSGGNLIFTNLPTSAPAVSGAVWNNSGVLNIV
jgi:hypothetical protein